MPTVFVTGTDTGCGKTYFSVALLHALRQQGLRAFGYKPVAAGCESGPEGWRNEDGEALLAASSPGLSYAQLNPIALRDPIAPHLAAADEGREINLAEIIAGAQALQSQADWLVVEGAGGFLVPLNKDESFADLLEQTQWPCILVVGMRLGCLNHALLSAEAIARRCQLAGWVANVLLPVQPRLNENIESLERRLSAPCLGVLRAPRPEQASGQISLSLLLDKNG